MGVVKASLTHPAFSFHHDTTTTIRLTKITAAQNEVALSYHRVRGLYFLAVVFAATITSTRYVFFLYFQNLLS